MSMYIIKKRLLYWVRRVLCELQYYLNVAVVKEEQTAYETMRADLETTSLRKWALVHDKKLVGIYETFQDAAKVAYDKFVWSAFLIKEIGAKPEPLPPSMLFGKMVRDRC